MKESVVERHLCQRIHRLGGECFKIIFPGRLGAPDRLVILPGGEVTWVELKRPKGGRLSMSQVLMHKRLKELIQEVVVLNSKEAIDHLFPLE